MAVVYPAFENILRSKQKLEDGELYLLESLAKSLPADVEIFFQPFVEGDRPDIILLQKDVGLTIIEVKDWNLNLYDARTVKDWRIKSSGVMIRSPLQQLDSYRRNFFEIYINDILIKAIKDNRFEKCIKTYVYFHNLSNKSLQQFLDQIKEKLNQKCKGFSSKLKEANSEHDKESFKLSYNESAKAKENFINWEISRFISQETIDNISLPKKELIGSKPLFNESMYNEFKRLLKPPFHKSEEGKHIKYTKLQSRLVISNPGFSKIKGVAGCGKTTVLARRAVNAHMRHQQHVLILTFNITLKSFIKDRISDVRENFGWDNFYIDNYHNFIFKNANKLGISMHDDENESDSEENSFSDLHLFEDHKEKLVRYKTIIIDEIQDYNPAWLEIIKRYFLEPEGELVLFGDEKQNIYERAIDENKTPIVSVKGFGRWEEMKRTFRFKDKNDKLKNILSKFQEMYFKNKYNLDDFKLNDDQEEYFEPTLEQYLDLFKMLIYKEKDIKLALQVLFDALKDFEIHQNDVTILSSDIAFLQNIDKEIRDTFGFKTMTTFENDVIITAASKHKKGYNYRKFAKTRFNLNNGMLKLATIHSFKGFESPVVCLFIREKDNAEVIYTGLTRSKSKIVVCMEDSNPYISFFADELELL